MEPYNLDLIAYQGSTFAKTFTISKEGLAWPEGTITWAAKIRSSDYLTAIESFAIAVTQTNEANIIIMSITAAKLTAILPVRYRWDLEATRGSDGWVWKIFTGNIFVKAEATKT